MKSEAMNGEVRHASGNVAPVTSPAPGSLPPDVSRPPTGAAGTTRRQFLRASVVTGGGAAGAGLLAASLGACSADPGDRPAAGTTHHPSSSPTPTRTAPAPDPDAPILSAAADAEQRLLTVYAETLARHPGLRTRLASFVRRHEQHLEALQSAGGTTAAAARAIAATETPSSSPGASPSESPSESGGDGLSSVPETPAAAVSALVSAEKDAATDRDTDVRRLRGPENARLLASIGACEATHVDALGKDGAA
jgi:hypothetical protein